MISPACHISVVVPVYNNRENIQQLVNRTETALRAITNNFEIILSDDASTDNSWEVIQRVCADKKFVRGVKLKKNCGQWLNTLAGMSVAAGKYLVTMDDDLQNPPEEIQNLYAMLTAGNYKIVFGMASKKYEKQSAAPFLSTLRKKLLQIFWQTKRTDSFRIFERGIVFNEKEFKPGILFEAFLTQTLPGNYWGYCETEFHFRTIGKSNYNFLRKARLFFLYTLHYYGLSKKENVQEYFSEVI